MIYSVIFRENTIKVVEGLSRNGLTVSSHHTFPEAAASAEYFRRIDPAIIRLGWRGPGFYAVDHDTLEGSTVYWPVKLPADLRTTDERSKFCRECGLSTPCLIETAEQFRSHYGEI